MSKDILVLYHANCLDGFGAAYAAWRKFGDIAEYIPVNYGQEPPDVTDKIVFIVDFSYSRDTLFSMKEKCKDVVVLDHHKTAQTDLDGVPFALFDMEKSGCQLAWEYFHPGFNMPTALFYIKDRDLWQLTSPLTEPFCQALRDTVDMDFESWDKVIRSNEKVYDLTKQGHTLMAVFERELDDIEKNAHPESLGGVKGLACNANSRYASKLGNRLAAKSGTFGVSYYFNGAQNKWICSLRSIGDFDVSEIAKQYGGGGHKSAAGFSVDRPEQWML